MAAPSGSAFPWVKRTSLRCRSREPALCCKFTNDDHLLVVGHFDGTIVVYDTQTLSTKYEINILRDVNDQREKLPVTSIALRPTAKPVLLLTASNGLVERYDMRTMEKFWQVVEQDNETYACDYAPNGSSFATAGRDAAIRIYDDNSGELTRVIHTAPEYPTNTAALRLFALKYDPQHPTRLLAGGWGNAVHIIDLTKDESRFDGDHSPIFFGPYLTGDALDVAHGTVLTASNRLEHKVQLWELDSESKEAIDVAWPVQYEFLPNCAKLSPTGEFIACGGGGGQGLREGAFVVERASGKPVVETKTDKSVTACAFAHREALVAFGDADGHVHLFENRFARKA